MNQLKEADFIRWGNTRRMTALRKVDQDGLWEGIKERQSLQFSAARAILKCLQIVLTIFGELHPS